MIVQQRMRSSAGMKIGVYGPHMSLVVGKPVFGVSDLVQYKPGCAVTDG